MDLADTLVRHVSRQREPSQRDNDLRLDYRNLAFKPGPARLYLPRKRVPVVRGPTFDDIGNIDIVPSEAYRGEK